MKNGNGKKVESYIAHASVKTGASARAILSAYKIEVRFLGGLTTAQKNAFKGAADRWSKVIVGDVPSVMIGGEIIDDILDFSPGRGHRRPRRYSRPGGSYPSAAGIGWGQCIPSS